MRSRPGYFIFWCPTISLCAIVAGFFAVMWANAPKIPSQGMEALIALPYAMASLGMLPFVVGLGILLWKRPKRAAMKLPYVLPTVLMTAAGISAYFLVPRANAAIQEISLSFVDSRGTPISDLDLQITHSSPGFDMIKGGRTHRVEFQHVSGNEFVLSKTKGEESEVRIEKKGFYLTRIDIPHVWPADRNFGLQRIHIGWQKDWGRMKWGVDACQASKNWPLNAPEPFQVILLDISAPAVSPLPEYSEEDLRAFDAANKKS